MTPQPEGTHIKSLANRLTPAPKKTRRTPAPAAQAPEDTAPPASQPAAAPSTPQTPPATAAKKSTAPTRRSSSTAVDEHVRVAIQLDADIHQAVIDHHGAGVGRGQSWAELIYEAIEATKDDLPAQIARDLAAEAQAKQTREPGQLFARPTRPTAANRVFIAPRMPQSARDTIDQMTREAGAPSRRHYIQAALRLHYAA